MTYKQFKEAATAKDIRNKFGTCSSIPPIVPTPYKEFYRDYNPVDVEIFTEEYNSIHFYSAEELESLSTEYAHYPDGLFIFASSNGDPIFIKEDGKVYTSYESRYLPELIADSFMIFLSKCCIV